jgi:hypothetical protein
MVWPILISVAVTPRISAASEPTGSANNASAPSAPNPLTKRIGLPSPLCRPFEWRPLQAQVFPRVPL